jgi:hypothetical protein
LFPSTGFFIWNSHPVGDDDWLLSSHIRVDFLSSSGLRDFFTIILFHEACETQGLTITSRFEGIRDDLTQSHRLVNVSESGILSEFYAFPSIVIDVTNTVFELLCRGSRDGFPISDFHRRGRDGYRTFTVIEMTKCHIFGGNTPPE